MFLLPFKISPGEENMRLDLEMLSGWRELPDRPRLRFYGWDGQWFSCGISQNPSEVKELLPPGANLVRRPTGGGIVDHRNDITYALAVGRNMPLSEMHAAESYKIVHAAIAAAMDEIGLKGVSLAGIPPAQKNGPLYSCFECPAQFDAVLSDGSKLAGAAQKRNRFGILFQGSLKWLPHWGKKRSAMDAVAKKFADIFRETIERVDFPHSMENPHAPADKKGRRD